MSTSSRFQADDFSGQWNVIAQIGDTDAKTVRYDLNEDGRIFWHLGEGVFDLHYGYLANQNFTSNGAGVLVAQTRASEFSDDQLVHWVDEDFRTAVVGYASRENAWILNRTPTLRADRLQAAKDILQFNGYDLSQLKTVPQ